VKRKGKKKSFLAAAGTAADDRRLISKNTRKKGGKKEYAIAADRRETEILGKADRRRGGERRDANVGQGSKKRESRNEGARRHHRAERVRFCLIL